MSLIDNTKSHLGGENICQKQNSKILYSLYSCLFNGLCHDFYNIALNMGGMSNQVFLLAFHELVIM